MMSNFKFARVRDVKAPNRANETDAGIDFFVPNDFAEQFVQPNGDIKIPAGVKVSIPSGFALVFMNKSGVATKKRLQVGACVVDESYQGEVHIHLFNVGRTAVKIYPGEKIVQGLLIPVAYDMPLETSADKLYDTLSSRGEGGFGSTGVV